MVKNKQILFIFIILLILCGLSHAENKSLKLERSDQFEIVKTDKDPGRKDAIPIKHPQLKNP